MHVRRVALTLQADGIAAAMAPAQANPDLIRMSESDENWVMQTKDYSATHFSKMTQLNANNVKNLKVAWTFSTGTLHGHEGGPLVADGIM